MEKRCLLLLLSIHTVYSFSNIFLSELAGLGYSHGGITGRAIRQIAYEYLNVTTEAEFLEKLPVELWTKHVDAVDLIEKFNDNVDNDPETKANPMYHFDAERFVRGNNLLIISQEFIIYLIQNGQYTLAREQLGKYLHTHQDFYSHSNWIEMGEKHAYRSLGEIDAFNGNVATINMSTCLNCQKPCPTCSYNCTNNIIPLLNEQKIFTSGYYFDETEDDQPVNKPTNVLKCSHGGIIDQTSDIPALGGINKDVKTTILSPHYYHQEKAADVAIESSYLFLKKLWHLTERKNDSTAHFGRFLELVLAQQSLIFVIDLTESMGDHLMKIQILLREIILNVTIEKVSMPAEMIIVTFGEQIDSMVIQPHIDGQIDRLLAFVNQLTVKGDVKGTMDAMMKSLFLSNDHCIAYVFTDQFDDNYDQHREVFVLVKRKHCTIHSLSLNERHIDSTIASKITGVQLNLQNDSLSTIPSLITQTLNTNTVPILVVHHSTLSTSDWYSFYVDSSVEQIQFIVNIKPNGQHFQNVNLNSLFISPTGTFIEILLDFDSPTVKIGRITQPSIGLWQLRMNSSTIHSFQIKLLTSIQFDHSFRSLDTKSHHPGLYHIANEPIQGSRLHSVIRLRSPRASELNFYELSFLDSSNHLLRQYNLIKQDDSTYRSQIEVPSVDFYIKIKGKNHRNELIERLYPHVISPRTLELDVTIDHSYFKPGEQGKVEFTLLNHHSSHLSIDLTVIQSLPIFDITLNQRRFILSPKEKQTSSFKLTASNNSNWINSSSEISIITKSSLQFNAFNMHMLRAYIISPLNHTEVLSCNALFPTGRTPHEMCHGSIESCASRSWDIHLNITSNIENAIHSIVFTYYDNQTVIQSNKETIQYTANEHHQSNLQLLLSPNNCCKKYADIVVYDRYGNRANCMEFQSIGPSE